VHLSVSLPAFVVAVLLISASPGPAMALILRRTALHGMRTAVPLILGLELGLYLWALAAAAGFAALVAASDAAYWVLKIVGACVLVYLGVRAWLVAWRERRGAAGQDGDAVPVDDHGPGRVKAFGEGLVVQLANPKAAVFMIAFYPQFVPADQPLFTTTALLALLQVAIELCFYFTLAAFVARAGAWFRRSTVRRRLEAVSGTVLVGLGLRVGLSSR
jgi:threonine/homoserine/homoserine lactone efflux protein